MNIKNFCIASGILLILAIPFSFTYAYYQFIRIFVCCVAIYVAWKFYESSLPAWTWIFSAVAFLFNPIVPIYLSKNIWASIDLISSILFFLAAYSGKQRRR